MVLRDRCALPAARASMRRRKREKRADFSILSALGRAANKGPAVMKLPEKKEVASWLAASAAAAGDVRGERELFALRYRHPQTLARTRLAEP